MGEHSRTGAGRNGTRGARRRRLPVALTVLAVLVALAATVGVARPDLVQGTSGWRLPWAAASAEPSCDAATVQVAVSPDVLRVTQDVLSAVDGTALPGGRCLRTEVSSSVSRDALARTGSAPVERAPHLWIPDSSIWPAQVERWPMTPAGQFASSPVVLATSQAAVRRLKWTSKAPTWADALGGPRSVALTGLTDNAPGITSLIGLWQSLGRDSDAEQAVAAAVLASTNEKTPTADAALAAAGRNAADAPLFITSEQTVFAANRGRTGRQLVAVYPRGATPMLDYPVLRVADRREGYPRAAVDAVVAALTGERARAAVQRQGLRLPRAAAAGGMPSRAELGVFVERLSQLRTSSRLLVLVDVSLSMQGSVPGTPLSRIELAARAAAGAGDFLPDTAAVGLWVFANDLDGERPYRVLAPLERLGADSGTPQRERVNRGLASLPRRLAPGGTALYASALSATRAMRKAYDPDAFNTVVLFTDGRNEDADGPSLASTLAQLTRDAKANPGQRVQIVGIAMGPDADLEALEELADATGGEAYRANSPEALQTVLFDALANRVR